MNQRTVVRRYPYNGAAYVYASVRNEKMGQGTIVTAGSSTTITSAGTESAFSAAAVGDEIKVIINGVTFRRYIVTRTSATSVIVDTAVNIPVAQGWYHTPQVAGITDADGWVDVSGLVNKVLWIQLDVKGSAGITYSVEAKADADNAVPHQLVTGTLTAAVVAGTTDPLAADTVVIPEYVSMLRVGILNNAGGTDRVSMWITGERAE